MGDTTVIHMALRKVLGILRNNASVHKPVGGGRGVYNDVSSLQSDNCSSDSSNMVGRMGPRSLCRGVPSISELQSFSSFKWHSSLDVGELNAKFLF